jgi:DNA primase
MINQETIQKILDTVLIEEVIGDFVTLKKAGSNYKGLSPFSNEKSPSFMVSPAKQIFKDFSSGKGGSAVTFLMEHEQYTYPEALRFLATKYNIEIEETAQSSEVIAAREEKESLFLVNDFANNYFQSQLWEDPKGRSIGLSYFQERGFSDETIKTFQLGYSPDGYQVFTDHALKSAHTLEFLSKVGLTKVDGERKIDRFRGRVMFPILSHTGRVLGFGGRILNKESKAAKYLNSPESIIYYKSKILYGIFHAKGFIAKADECFLVEGYTDVISLFQADVKNVVSSSGTALTVDQIILIKRFTKNITLLYDGDPAGIKASLRGIDLILEQGMNVRVVLFPDGEDPDSYSKRVSVIELKSYLAEERTNFLRFKAKLLLNDVGTDPLEKAKAAREMVQSIALMPDELDRTAFIQETARILSMEERILFSELGQMRSRNITKVEEQARREERRQSPGESEVSTMQVVETTPPVATSLLYPQEEALCILLLNHGEKEIVFEEADDENENPAAESIASYILAELVSDSLDMENPFFQQIFQHFLEVYNNEEQRISKAEEFLRGANKELMHKVVDLISEEPALHDWNRKKIFPPAPDEHLRQFTIEAVLRFKEKKISSLIKGVQSKLESGEKIQISDLETVKNLNTLRVEIDKKLNRIL